MTLPGLNSEQKRELFSERHKLLMKWVAVAQIRTRIGVPCIVFREESEYDTPGAQF